MKRLTVHLVIAYLSWGSICHAQMTFTTNLTSNSAANVSFAQAADTWASEFRDDITVNLQYGFVDMDDGTVATASSGIHSVQYTEFWDAIGNDITTAHDSTMFNGLPTGTSFSVYINQTREASGAAFEIPYVDNDGGANNSNVFLSAANAKALGLFAPHAESVDGFVMFNNSYDWDFDPSDGIEMDHLDFYGTAMHEIGHTLGFQSGVDNLDANGDGQFSDNDFPYVTSLDFLRFSTASELAGADIDWTADSRAKYFSIDGGLTSVIGGSEHWSTGLNYGDGEQASHWKDGVNLGIMDPTTNFGLVNSISSVDLIAFDVIGYDRGLTAVPEPGGFAGMLALGIFVLRRRRS